MPENVFSNEQVTVIEELREILKKCKQLNIHIARLSEYEVSEHVDANGKVYIGLT